MKVAHTITTTVFCREYEDETEITDALKKLFPYPVEKLIQTQTATGVNEDKIRIITIQITKESQTNKFIQNLMQQLNEKDKKTLEEQKQSRLDQDQAFYIRISKPALIEGKYELTDNGDCYHIKIQLASYPKNRKTALKIIDSIL